MSACANPNCRYCAQGQPGPVVGNTGRLVVVETHDVETALGVMPIVEVRDAEPEAER